MNMISHSWCAYYVFMLLVHKHTGSMIKQLLKFFKSQKGSIDLMHVVLEDIHTWPPKTNRNDWDCFNELALAERNSSTLCYGGLTSPRLYLACLPEPFLRQQISQRSLLLVQCCSWSLGWSVYSAFPRHSHKTRTHTCTGISGSICQITSRWFFIGMIFFPLIENWRL